MLHEGNTPGHLAELDEERIESLLKDLLCDDALKSNSESVLVERDFEPDSFTVGEWMSSRVPFLREEERDLVAFLTSLLRAEIDMVQSAGIARIAHPPSVAAFVLRQLMVLLRHREKGDCVADRVYMQELPDVVRKVLAFCLFGAPDRELDTHRRVNDWASRVLPVLIERHLTGDDPHRLLAVSIAGGLIGLDSKGTGAAASSIVADGIPLGAPFESDPVTVADEVFASLEEVISRSFAIDHWPAFVQHMIGSKGTSLVWFTDDYIETIFDLYLAQRLLEESAPLKIHCVPRNGQHGSDASYRDVKHMLDWPFLSRLQSHFEQGRFSVSSTGPRMGAINLRKLSREVANAVSVADAVYIKGCRGHELVQGGVNAVTYTSFVVAREFTESETGLNAREVPLAFFRLEPGEYAYWGFTARHLRPKTLEGGRHILLCSSTLEEHEKRKVSSDGASLVADIDYLVSIYHRSHPRYRRPYDQEIALILDRLCEITRDTYNIVAERYAEARSDTPGPRVALWMQALLDWARRAELGGPDHAISLLDVGAGHGRDLCYLTRMRDVRPVGIDNARGFIDILRGLADARSIPQGSFYEMDMRNMDRFGDCTFDVVRNNATLLHLPMLPSRMGADEAVAEAFRVLRPHGVLFVSVKAGCGLRFEDTREGFGPRVFQYYTECSLTELLQRNGFNILKVCSECTERPGATTEWLIALADKPGPA